MNLKTWLLLVLLTVFLPVILNILIHKTVAERLLYTPAPKPKPDICYLELDKGPCNILEQRSWHNPKTGNCEYFAYGGCKGNKNNFISIEECIYNCEPDYNEPIALE